MPGTLRIAILTGQDSTLARATVSALARLPGTQVVGIVFDSGRVSLKEGLARLDRSVRREGWSYIWFRVADAFTGLLERLAARVVPASEVSAIFAAAFPGQALSLAHLGELLRIPIFSVDTLNSTGAVEILRRLEPDLGIAIGTRILVRSTFSVPRIGCLSLRLGQVPEDRGTPPGFWELYDGRLTAGVTVHLIDDGPGTADVVAQESVAIHPLDTLETLGRRLETSGRDLLTRCVADFAHGQATRQPQQSGGLWTRTSPTRRERKQLERRLRVARPKKAPWLHAIKTACYLVMYYAGLPQLLRASRRLAGRSRACVLLYHRMNDLSLDPLTIGVRRFVEHMAFLRKHYAVLSSSMLIEKLESGQPFSSNSVVITFDDCYRDVSTNAKPVLDALGLPASMFVSSGYVGTQRRFPHDDASPWLFENLRPEDLRAMAANGCEVGSHTVTHIDLGRAGDETIAAELAQSKRDLEAIIHRPVVLFAFPFGRETNIRGGAEELVRRAGYRAIFSAYGGYVTDASDLFDLRRVGVGGDMRALDLAMEIEGLSAGALRRWRKRWAWRPRREPSRGRSTAGASRSGTESEPDSVTPHVRAGT
jgi:peptidoglycan/xylan/chitin deacetylase (PgdA/CDA1 family)